MLSANSNSTAKLDKAQFEQLFKAYYPQLCAFSRKYVQDEDTARELVQVVFLNLWQKRDTVTADASLKAFLFKSVYNRSLNHLRDQKKFVGYELSDDESGSSSHPFVNHDALEEEELKEKINAALAALPERCREIFMMSRFEELRYAQIAEKLNISVKTVEAQMGKALGILREKLKDHLPLLLFLLWFKNF